MPNKTDNALLSEALLTSQRCIPYIPSLKLVFLSVIAVLIFQQLEYWFSLYADGFYKFLAPCDHAMYRTGDSWTEELALSLYEFRSGFDKLGVRYKSKAELQKKVQNQTDIFQGKYYYSVVDIKQGLTYYRRNDEKISDMLKGLFLSNIEKKRTQRIEKHRDVETESLGMKKLHSQGLRNSIPRNEESESPIKEAESTQRVPEKTAASVGGQNSGNPSVHTNVFAAASFGDENTRKKTKRTMASKMIGDSITQQQTLDIQHFVDQLKLDEKQSADLVQAISQAMLDTKQFKSTGQDFQFKLNTIKKLYINGGWVPHLDHAIHAKSEGKRQEEKARQMLQLKYQSLLNDNLALTKLIKASQDLDGVVRLQKTQRDNNEQLRMLSEEIRSNDIQNNRRNETCLL
jgi:hypothetical protein